MDTIKYEIICTKGYYGYPEAKYKYKIKDINYGPNSNYFELEANYYGNHGWDILKEIGNKDKCNGYFWYLQAFIKYFYSTEGRDILELNKEGDKLEIVLEMNGARIK